MARREPTWLENLNALRQWVVDHDGKFPASNCGPPEDRDLGSWWAGQRTWSSRLSAARQAAMEDTVDLAREVRKKVSAERRAAALKQSRDRVQPVVLAMAKADIKAARAALKKGGLTPEDVEVLQLRLDHPTESRNELSTRLGLSKMTFSRRLDKALGRKRRR